MQPAAWYSRRREALERLRRHVSEGLVDSDIEDWLLRINEDNACFFTTSSCSGRLVLLESATSLLDKAGARSLWVTHDARECLDICRIPLSELAAMGSRLSWLSLQPPILHFLSIDEGWALEIVRCARESGFIRSCYRKEAGGYYFVEVAVHDKLHVTLPVDCTVVSALCSVMARYKERLERFKTCIESLKERCRHL
ncbi:MAG: hypothetical protein GSR80_001675 [Desulfurococcales archaeon]|nr:hypothetical protein [Desulfurococcales archaeon]